MKLSTIVPQKVINRIPDKQFVYLTYWQITHDFLNLKHPKSFSEKLQWIKLNGNLERYAPLVDKYEVRKYIKDKIGEKYLIPLIGCWDTFDQIPFDTLPKRFVLKATHGSGYNYICLDKSKINMPELKRLVNGWLQENYYIFKRERQYKHLKPRIICEKYMEDEHHDLRDYKFYCTREKIQFIEVHSDRSNGQRVNIFNEKWQELAIKTISKGSDTKIDKPANLTELLKLTKLLSKPFPFVRVDLYSVHDQVYFGELTFTPADRIFPFVGQSNYDVGAMLNLEDYLK